jgi:hypothetical protein
MSNIEVNGDQADDDVINTFFRHVGDEAFPLIDAATVPIYGFQDNKVKQDRTGILFRIAGTYFILTAAHRIQEIIQAKIPLLVDFSTKHKIPIPLVEAKFYGTEEENGRDVAVIAIPPSVVSDLPAQRRFLTLADIDREPKPKKGFYAVFGFPTEWYRKVEDVQRTDPLSFFGSIYEGELDPNEFFDPRVYIAITFDRNAINVLTGKQRQLPQVTGMSGCGIWRLVNKSKAEITGWSVDKIRLVAIQHRWSRERQYIKGTWITYALDLIWENYPSLRGAWKLYYRKGY